MPVSASSRVFVATVSLALLAGCSGSTSVPPQSPVSAQSVARSGARTAASGYRADISLARPGIRGLLSTGTPHFKGDAKDFTGTAWVTDEAANLLYKVSAAGKIKAIGTGWNQPQGVAIDKAGHVYVADTANSRVVVLTKAGKADTILNDPGEFPVAVGVAADGTIGVVNLTSTSGGAGSISFYSSLSQTEPTSTASGLLYQDYSGGFDASDNFYVLGVDANDGIHVGVVSAGGTTVADTGIDTSTYLFPGGLQVIESGKGAKTVQTLTVGDQGAPVVYTYALPGYAAGASVSLGGSGDVVGYSFQKNLKAVGAADAEFAEVNFYAWPAGGSSPTASVAGFEEPGGIGIVATGDE
jgi:hypothetical protein